MTFDRFITLACLGSNMVLNGYVSFRFHGYFGSMSGLRTSKGRPNPSNPTGIASEQQVPSIDPIEGASVVFVNAYYCGFRVASHILAPSQDQPR